MNTNETKMTVAQLREMQKLAMEKGEGDLFTYLGYLIQQREAQPMTPTPNISETAQQPPRTRAEAEARGYIVDDTCYPWVAYKGSRFVPQEWHRILTDTEAELLEALTEIRKLSLYPAAHRKENWSARVSSMSDIARRAIASVEGRAE